jgi:hypothetical protein
VLTPDQITAIAPDAPSLKAGRDLGTARKWQSIGGDDAVLWGLAMGSGKDPYQTRVALADLASKCSCPSRKFPCKHAIGLMFLATGDPAALTQKERPPWVTEWLDSRAAREEKAAARSEDKAAKPVDEKAAEKRRAQRENRVGEGVAMLQQALLDLAREGLASANARNSAAWENLAKRMVDSQAPGLAGNLRHIADTVLRDPDVDVELPLEIGRLHLLLHAVSKTDTFDGPTQAELRSLIGGRNTSSGEAGETVDDHWFAAGRRVEERDRLITSATWMIGIQSRRWARLLRFAPVPQTIIEPWPLGSTVHAALKFQPGLHPLRAAPENEDAAYLSGFPAVHEDRLELLLVRFANALAANPFLRALPFFIPLRPVRDLKFLADSSGRALPWSAEGDTAFVVECVCGGHFTPMCGEWDGRSIRLLAMADGGAWIPLTPQQP